MRITYINSSTDLKDVYFLSKCAWDTHTINHDRQLLAYSVEKLVCEVSGLVELRIVELFRLAYYKQSRVTMMFH